MWTLNCGCNAPIPEQIIFDIPDDKIQIINSSKIIIPNIDDSKIWCLKEKVIKDYLDILNKLECGIQPNIENILQEISLIDINCYE